MYPLIELLTKELEDSETGFCNVITLEYSCDIYFVLLRNSSGFKECSAFTDQREQWKFYTLMKIYDIYKAIYPKYSKH